MATRFYFSSSAGPIVSPAFGAWDRTSEAVRKKMSPVKDGSTATIAPFFAGSDIAADGNALSLQLVSDPLAPGNVFTTATTVKCYNRVREQDASNNINRQPIRIWVASQDGTTLRSELLAIGHRGPNTNEWVIDPTAATNKTFADSDFLSDSWTTLAGDRLVVEIGGQVSSAGGTAVVGAMAFGASGADIGENETDTTGAPWFEISTTLSFLTGGTGGEVLATSYGVQSGGGIAPALPLGLRGGVGRPGPSPKGFAIFRSTNRSYLLTDLIQPGTVVTVSGVACQVRLGGPTFPTVAVVIDVSVSVTGAAAAGAIGDESAGSSQDAIFAVSGVSSAGLSNTTEDVVGIANVSTTGVAASGSGGAVVVSGFQETVSGGPSYGIGYGGGIAPVLPLGTRGNVGRPGASPKGFAVFNPTLRRSELSAGPDTADVAVAVTGLSLAGVLGVATAFGDLDLTTTLPSYGVQSGGGVSQFAFGAAAVGYVAPGLPPGMFMLRPSPMRLADLSQGGEPLDVPVTGVSAAMVLSNEDVVIGFLADATGVNGTPTLGNVTVTGVANIPAPAAISAAVVGTPSVSGAANVSPLGTTASGAVGAVSVDAAQVTLATGVSVTGVVGASAVTGNANVQPSAAIGVGTLGAVSIDSNEGISVGVQSVAAVGALGIVAVSANANVGVVSVSASGSVGNEGFRADVAVAVTGVSAAGSQQTPAVAGAGNVTVTGASAAGAVGNTAQSFVTEATPSGVSAAGVVGIPTFVTSHILQVFGVQAAAILGNADSSVFEPQDAQAFAIGVSTHGDVGQTRTNRLITDSRYVVRHRKIERAARNDRD